MSLQLLPLTLWEAVPFGDQDAWLDWNLQHWLSHIELAKKTKTEWITLDNLKDDPFPHSQLHRDIASILGLKANFDFANYDLKDRNSYYDFMLSHSHAHADLNLAAGL